MTNKKQEKDAGNHETLNEFIIRLSETNTSSVEDSRIFQKLLRSIGFSNAVVTCGIVYEKGQGTIEAPPAPIQTYAKAIRKSFEKRGMVTL